MLVDKIKLEQGEKVLVQTRRHWFVITSQIASFVLVALAPLVLYWALRSFSVGDININLSNYTPQIVFLYSLFLLFIWTIIFSLLTNYYLDVLTITDRRAILIDQKGFFWRNVSSFRLERMQDLNISVNGLIATLLDFGTIQVETASDAQEEFRATNVPSPSRIKSVILQAADNRLAYFPSHDPIHSP